MTVWRGGTATVTTTLTTHGACAFIRCDPKQKKGTHLFSAASMNEHWLQKLLLVDTAKILAHAGEWDIPGWESVGYALEFLNAELEQGCEESAALHAFLTAAEYVDVADTPTHALGKRFAAWYEKHGVVIPASDPSTMKKAEYYMYDHGCDLAALNLAVADMKEDLKVKPGCEAAWANDL